MINENTSKEDLQETILFSDDGLYKQVNEQKFLDGGYTQSELFAIVQNWIEAGDECAQA